MVTNATHHTIISHFGLYYHNYDVDKQTTKYSLRFIIDFCYTLTGFESLLFNSLAPGNTYMLKCTWSLLVRVKTFTRANVESLSSGPSEANFSQIITEIPWWRHQMETFSALLALCVGNSPVPVNSPHKGQWRGALMFCLIRAWINSWVNNCEAGDLGPYLAHYDVIVMQLFSFQGNAFGSFVCNMSAIFSESQCGNANNEKRRPMIDNIYNTMLCH